MTVMGGDLGDSDWCRRFDKPYRTAGAESHSLSFLSSIATIECTVVNAMALQGVVRRSSVLCNANLGTRLFVERVSRRNASAMAVPTSSQVEMTRNDISVSQVIEDFVEHNMLTF